MPDEFIRKWKEYYKKLKPIYCPALSERIHFNAKGFNHLLYKNSRPRTPADRNRRLWLLRFVNEVITKGVLSNKQMQHGDTVFSVILDLENKNKAIRVVVKRKNPNGKLYFLSVMDSK